MAIQDRVINILTKPAEEWNRIAAESADTTGLIRDYAAPLAAIPAVCRFIGFSMVGMSLGFHHVESSPLTRSSYHAREQAAK